MSLPTDEVVAEQLLGHLRDSSSDTAPSELRVPVRYYFDAEHAERERAHVRQQPVVIGHSSQLPEAGSFFTTTEMGVPILVVRQPDGSVRAVRNVCRHRGARVEPAEAGTKRVFVCKYHGWTYDRDGSLRNVPYGEYFPEVDPACNGLVPLPAEERHGLIWSRLDGSADGIDVASHLGPTFDGYLASLRLDEWPIYRSERYELSLNWKLVIEGAMDPLHLRFLHPDTVGRLIETNTNVWNDDGDHGRLSMARRKMTKLGDAEPEASELRHYVVQSHFFYPNLMINTQPASYEMWTVFPDVEDAERCHVTIRVLAPAELTDEERLAIDKTWDVLVDAARSDDWPMEQTIQDSIRETGAETFTVGLSEVPIQHFHRRLRANMGLAEG